MKAIFEFSIAEKRDVTKHYGTYLLKNCQNELFYVLLNGFNFLAKGRRHGRTSEAHSHSIFDI